ncbi:MAG: hypothetical protein RR980_03560 [Mucinivorans sp.]
MEQKPMLPNAVSTLVLGICSILFTFFFVGLVLAIIGLAISGAGARIYRDNPTVWGGYNMLTAGRTLCIIGTVLSSLYALFFVIMVLFMGAVSVWGAFNCI